MEIWTEVRRRVLTGELSKRAACQEYGLNWRTLEKMLSHVQPPGYRRQAKREQPVLGPHLAWIHEVLEQSGILVHRGRPTENPLRQQQDRRGEAHRHP